MFSGQGSNRDDTGLVPVNSPVELGECPSIEFRPGFQSNRGSGHLKSPPYPGLWQRPHRLVRRVVAARAKRFIGAPMGPVFPTAVIELQLDRFGWVFWIEENIRKQPVVRVDWQWFLGSSKEVLRDAFSRTDRRILSAEDRMLGRRDKLPGIGSVSLGFRAGWQFVVEPDLVILLQCGGLQVAERICVIPVGDARLNRLFRSGHVLLQLRLPRQLGTRGNADHRWWQQGIAVHRLLGEAEEIGEQLIKLFLRQWIVLVVVAGRATRS